MSNRSFSNKVFPGYKNILSGNGFSGLYFYNDGTEGIPFQIIFTEKSDTHFIGRSAEPNTFIEESYSLLEANIKGIYTDNYISFEKTYTFPDGYSIIYKAEDSEEGTWSIPDANSGKWIINI